MKLYATTTSERASKGQGGEWLKISVTDKNKENILNIVIETDKNDMPKISKIDGWDYITQQIKTLLVCECTYCKKGKRQKGEI